MTVELLNPPDLPVPTAFYQVGVATGTTTVYVSGQVARTADGTPVGAGDLAAQTEQVYRNLDAALRGAGASFADVVKLTAYVVDWTPEKMAELGAGAARAAEALGIDIVKPITLLGVAALAEPDLLIEVEAIAVR
ncbi:RidA family protein [Actinophytocola xanthii]|uniref:Enamine deaminase RidA n=1 Tax=Actinophytocola xanthii TaxID=1912961 RepID=A0A1Q8CGD2_9PSEU|nr:RidA family protein [Actinophytocola xanthii]OLF13382.1 enamine deaminase RidA [Actinophytocola xanthii]